MCYIKKKPLTKNKAEAYYMPHIEAYIAIMLIITRAVSTPRDVKRRESGFIFCERNHFRGCPGVPVHGGIPIVFISIHGVVTQFVNVSFLCVPVHEDTTPFPEVRTN